MCIFCKLLLDIMTIISIFGAIGFIVFVKQEKVYFYMNMVLVSILCIVYWLYFTAVRKIDLMRYLEKNKFSERNCFARNVGYLIASGLPYWSLIYIYSIIMCTFFVYPVITMTIVILYKDSVMPVVCAFSACTAILYLCIIKAYISDFKMRYRVKFHGGSLLIFIGIVLSTIHHDGSVNFLGGLLIVVGICLICEILWQCLCGTNLRIEQEMAAPLNGNAGIRIQPPMTFLEMLRRGLWHIIV